MKKNLLVSFSGGETSAFMSQYIKNHLENTYENVLYAFANTGLENEETLIFAKQCDDYFNLNLKYVEAVSNKEKGVGTDYFLTSFENLKRNGEPFESVISKYGISNVSQPHCTRELKQVPLNKLARDFFKGEKYDTAIGIRVDEIDRINDNYKDKRLIYPLADPQMKPTSKQVINLYWKNMPFRLQLKGYQGNCKTCWKKSDKKLFQIYKDNPNAFDFMIRMEKEHSLTNAKQNTPHTFFRGNRSALDIIEGAKLWNGNVYDDSKNYNYQIDMFEEGESCEVFSNCGDK
jgi:hypothetical protein